jgi:hypothetical protein
MHTFEITVRSGSGNSWPIVVEQSDWGVDLSVQARGTLELDPQALLGKDAHGYGVLLGQALFRSPIRDLFIEARAISRGELHIVVEVEADEAERSIGTNRSPSLRTVHWERLSAPSGTDWSLLSRDQRIPLSLQVHAETTRFFRSAPKISGR